MFARKVICILPIIILVFVVSISDWKRSDYLLVHAKPIGYYLNGKGKLINDQDHIDTLNQVLSIVSYDHELTDYIKSINCKMKNIANRVVDRIEEDLFIESTALLGWTTIKFNDL